jgi:hypothetical protein
MNPAPARAKPPFGGSSFRRSVVILIHDFNPRQPANNDEPPQRLNNLHRQAAEAAFARAGRGLIPVCSGGSSIQRPMVIRAAHLSNGRWSSGRLIYPMAGGHPGSSSVQ